MIEASEWRTPRGNLLSLALRDGTSDKSIVTTLLAGDEYLLRGRELTGWAIDLGAHVGTVAAALLADNPLLRVIAIEPLPENFDLLERNLAPFGERAKLLRAIAGKGDVSYAYGGLDLPESYAHDNRYIGGPLRSATAVAVEAPHVTLADVLAAFAIDRVDFIKTDCESGEWEFFADATANAKVNTIVGEFHDDPTEGRRIVDLLRATHDVTILTPGSVGLFEAVRR